MLPGILSIFVLLVWRLRCPKSPVDSLIKKYGRPVLATYRTLEKLHISVDKLKLDIDFLRQCKVHETVPKFIKFKVYSKQFLKCKTYREWQFFLLDREISQQRKKLKNSSERLASFKSQFKSKVSFLDYWVYYSKILDHTKFVCNKIKARHDNKLNRLGVHQTKYNEGCIFNISSRGLSQREKKVLMLGLDFCIPFYKREWLNHFLSVEKICNTIQDCVNQGLLKSGGNGDDIINRVREVGGGNYRLALKEYKNVESVVFNKGDLDLLKELGKDKSIVISKPDKGKGVVIMDKSDYVQKMEGILDDQNRFRVIKGDLFNVIVKLEDKLNRMLRSIKDKIGLEAFNFLYASGTGPGVMYGLPKVRKEGVPTRPIVSSIKTAGYNLAKFLQPLVLPLTKNQYTVNNSKEFVSDILGLKLPQNFVLASYDVESLFTNVPLMETLDIILDSYREENFFNIGKDIVKKLFLFVTTETCFLFNNVLYSQVDGVSMGSSLGPLFAGSFLCAKEVEWLNNCPIAFKPIYYRRYVDDTFLVFRDEESNKRFFEYINDQHKNIRFTCDNEENGSLSFLDIKICKGSNGLTTEVFRKPTHTGLGLSWFSACPKIFKVNSIKTLLERAYSICSSFDLLHCEFEVLRKYFLMNNYKADLFDKILKRFLYAKQAPSVFSPHEVPRKVVYMKMPFYGNISYEFRKIVNKYLRESFPAVNFRFVFTNEFRIGSFFSFKDRVPDHLCSNIVYEFKCPSCEARYLGCTGRSFRIRIFEHMGKSYRTGKFLDKMPFSAVRNHARSNDHRFDVKDFKIMARFRNQSDAFIGEKLLINRHNPEINTANNAS